MQSIQREEGFMKRDLRRKVWTHPKLKKEFGGKYEAYSIRDPKKRAFCLFPLSGKGTDKFFVSHEAAKKAGWSCK